MTIKKKLERTLRAEFSHLSPDITRLVVWSICGANLRSFEEVYKDIISETEIEQGPASQQDLWVYEVLLRSGRRVCQDAEMIDFFKTLIRETIAGVDGRREESQALQAQPIRQDPVKKINQKRKSDEIAPTLEKSPEVAFDDSRNVKQKTDSPELNHESEDDDGFRYT